MALTLGSSVTLTLLALCVGILVSELFDGPPTALLVALVFTLVLRMVINLYQVASFYIRRSARRRRMRRRVAIDGRREDQP